MSFNQATNSTDTFSQGRKRIGAVLIGICFVILVGLVGNNASIHSRVPAKEEAISMVIVGDASRFYLSKGKGTWANKQAACQATGGHLASVHNARENAQVASVCNNIGGCWIGLNDRKVDQKWVWTDGTTYNYANWNTGEPNGRRREACVQVYARNSVRGKWNDLPCTHKIPAVCERVSQIRSYSCPPGLFILTTMPAACVCKKCPAGWKCKGGKSRPSKCPKGTYQTFRGQNTCAEAPRGKFVDKAGSRFPKSCPRGTMCPGIGGKSPIPCNFGTFQPKPGKTKCIKAGPGRYVPRRGMWKQMLCPINTFQSCSAQKTCIECPIGKKQPRRGSNFC